MKTRGINPNQGYKTLKDIAKIISLFNTFQVEERSISEISKAVGMLPSKVSRMIRTLEGEGFFERDLENGKYRLGVRFFELGITYVFNFPLRKVLRPHLEQIFKELNLTTSWGILRNDKVIVVDRIQNLNIDLLKEYTCRFDIKALEYRITKLINAYGL